MPLNGNGVDIERAPSPQEAAINEISTLLARVEGHCTSIVCSSTKSVQTIHQLRVDVRRSLAALQVFHNLVPDSELVWFRKKLKRLRRLSGEVRDLDVLARRLAEVSSQQHTSKRSLKCLTRIARRMRSKRPSILKPLQREISRILQNGTLARHRKKLLKGILRANSLPANTPVGDRPNECALSIQQLPAIIHKFQEASQFSIFDLHSVHQFRLKTKELRYALEILSCFLQESVIGQLLPFLSQLQQTLGEINDQRFAYRRLKKLSKNLDGCDQRYLLKLSKCVKRQLNTNLESLSSLWTVDAQQQLKTQVESLVQ